LINGNFAQPALLYLAPACSFSVIICAAIRGELTELWAYSDNSGERAEADKETDKTIHSSAISDKDMLPPAPDISTNPKLVLPVSPKIETGLVSEGAMSDDELTETDLISSAAVRRRRRAGKT